MVDRKVSLLAFLLTGFLMMFMPSVDFILFGDELSAHVTYFLHNVGFVVFVVGAYFAIVDFFRMMRR